MRWPDFDEFWAAGYFEIPEASEPYVLFEDFRSDPESLSARDAIGTYRDFLREDCRLRLRRLPRASGVVRARGMARQSEGGRVIHCICSRPNRGCGCTARWIWAHQPTEQGSRARADADESRRCRGARNPQRRRGAGVQRSRRDSRGRSRERQICGRASSRSRPAPGTIRPRPGVIGSLDKHGNPNVLTLDKGTSRLAAGAQRADRTGAGG